MGSKKIEVEWFFIAKLERADECGGMCSPIWERRLRCPEFWGTLPHCLWRTNSETSQLLKTSFLQNFVRRFEGLHVHHTTTPSFCLGGEFQNRRRIIRTGTSTSKYEKKNCLSYTTSTYRGRFLFFVQQCEKNCIILHNLNGRVLI